MEKMSLLFKRQEYFVKGILIKMPGQCELWKEWTFSSSLQDNIDKLVKKKISESQDSDISRQWLFLKNFNFETQFAKSESEEISSEERYSCDVEGLVHMILEAIECNSILDESQFQNLPKSVLSEIFCKVHSALSETGFLNFCKILSMWNDQKIINICFDHIVLNKLKENEEAKLSVISALTELAKNKSEDFCKCIAKLLHSTSNNFTDVELLENVFVVMPNDKRESIIKILTEEDNFKESNWHLLQTLSCKSNAACFFKIITFMNSKCEQFASSQAFAKLLVHICKNSLSAVHKDTVLNIIQKNKTLLKKQALRNLLSLED